MSAKHYPGGMWVFADGKKDRETREWPHLLRVRVDSQSQMWELVEELQRALRRKEHSITLHLSGELSEAKDNG